MPDERLSSLHLAIEYAVSHTLKRRKNLQDKDIEWVYEQYRNYFQALRQGKDPADPDSTRHDRSELMDYLWECLVKWEAAGGPADLLDGSFRPAGRPITQVEELYVMGFNNLRKSCRIHRRQDGPRGYVVYVKQWVNQILADDPELAELLDPSIPAQGGVDFSGLYEKYGYHVSLKFGESGIPAIDAAIFESDEEPSLAKLRSLLSLYPGVPTLRSELATLLEDEENPEEATALWQGLIAEFPKNAYYTSGYLNFLLKTDQPHALAECERLGFSPLLKDYTPEEEDGYRITSLINHSAVTIQMAMLRNDAKTAMELLNDLLATGLPDELISSIATYLLIYRLKNNTENNPGGAEQQNILHDFPQYPHATAMINMMWGEILEEFANTSGHNYPAAFDQDYPWPRNPHSVERAFQLRIHIVDSEPEIFRTIVVPDDTLLPDLHGILQTAFDWEESHLHEFIQDDDRFVPAHPEAKATDIDYEKIRINELLINIGDSVTYHYDFGDGWMHHVVLEAIPEVDDEILYPRCLAGARRGPLEDSGGIIGYQEKLEILADPNHPEYEDIRAWVPKDFDPDDFVLAWTHKQLWKGRFRHLGNS